jgi:hypothetical protein
VKIGVEGVASLKTRIKGVIRSQRPRHVESLLLSPTGEFIRSDTQGLPRVRVLPVPNELTTLLDADDPDGAARQERVESPTGPQSLFDDIDDR